MDNFEDNSEMLLEQEDERSPQKIKTALVYSWGRNEDGELANTATKTAAIPNPIRGFRGVVKQIASARTHTAVINTQGQIYMAGSLLFGKIGINAQINNFREFHLHTAMTQHRVRKVACGDYHTLALTQQGVVYSWGGTLWDKTGHKVGGIHRIQHLKGQQITDIACGDFHSLALNSEGQVYSWGGGGQNKNKGQLGHSNKKDLPVPHLIQFFKDKRAIKIACGDYHSMVLTRDEELYSFGEGTYGQLGTGGKEDHATPRKVVLNYSVSLEDYFTSDLKQQTRVQQMALGGKHSLILTNKGHIYVCGFGSQGQLGLGNTQNKYTPFIVQSLLGKRVVMVAAGASHSLCLTDKNDIFSCGYNAKGQLGLGDDRSLTSTCITNWTHVRGLQGKKVKTIYAGSDHSWAVLDQYEPFIDDYEPPSPIRLSIDVPPSKMMPTLSKQPQQYDSFINDLSTTKKLQLILTEVQLSHRFIHFVFKDKLVKNCKTMIDSYIEAVRKVEGDNLKFYKLSQDGEIFDAQGQLTLPNNPRGMSVMLVCELPPQANEHLPFMTNGNKIAIGDFVMMESNMLKVEGKVPVHNFWFFKFANMFENQLEKVRFVELRPKPQ